MNKNKIEKELIKNISSRVEELLKKCETGNYNDATLYAFHVGLCGDIEEAFKQYKKELKDEN